MQHKLVFKSKVGRSVEAEMVHFQVSGTMSLSLHHDMVVYCHKNVITCLHLINTTPFHPINVISSHWLGVCVCVHLCVYMCLIVQCSTLKASKSKKFGFLLVTFQPYEYKQKGWDIQI